MSFSLKKVEMRPKDLEMSASPVRKALQRPVDEVLLDDYED